MPHVLRSACSIGSAPADDQGPSSGTAPVHLRSRSSPEALLVERTGSCLQRLSMGAGGSKSVPSPTPQLPLIFTRSNSHQSLVERKVAEER